MAENMAYRALCVHGKVRAMCVDDALTTGRCFGYLRDFKRWAAGLDHVTAEEARKSDFDCADCEEALKAKRRQKRAKP